MFSIASVALGGMLERQHQASPNADRRNSATYVEMLHSGGRTTATAGARLDHSSTYGDFGTYRVSLSQVVAGALRVRGSVGTAFREPSFFESFDTPFSVANLALRPERTTSWETGVEGALARERLTMGVTYFHQRFVDLVDYRFSPSGSTYENIARARAAGAEVELRVVLPAAATADASYTFLDSKVLRSGFNPSPLATLHEGGPLLRRPTRSGSAGLSLPFAGGAALGARATYVGTREDRRFHGAPTFETDAVALNPYTKIDLAGTLPFALFLPTLHAVTASLRLDNAFGARYESVAGYATPGRTILAGLRADF
jgi:vitamin B12 transporter